MTNQNKTKNWLVGIIALAVVIAVGIGAYQGRTQETSPSEVTTSASTKVGGAEKSSETDKELKVVKTWTMKDCSLTPWLVTDKLGYFTQEGIKLVFTGETQAAQQIPSIINGNNDVGAFHPNTIAVAKAGGARITGVLRAGIEPDDSVDPKFRHMFWYVNPNKLKNVKSFADLKNIKGKLKFSTITNNICADFLANTIADKYGIPRDKIEWVSMPDIQAIQALKQGLIDVAGVHPPFYKGMDDSGALKIADTSEAGLGPAAGVSFYIFNEDFVKNNSDTVNRFNRAIIRGQRWANEHPAEAAKWTEEAIGVPVTGSHYYAVDTKILESEIDPWVKDLVDNKVIPKGKLSSGDIITHQFE